MAEHAPGGQHPHHGYRAQSAARHAALRAGAQRLTLAKGAAKTGSVKAKNLIAALHGDVAA